MRRCSATFMDKVDDGAKPSSATRLAKVAEDERRVASLILIVGCFRTLVIDLPWDYDWLSLAGRAVPGWLRPQDRPDMGQAAAIRSRFLLPQSNRTRALPATRGDLDTRSDSISTVFEAPWASAAKSRKLSTTSSAGPHIRQTGSLGSASSAKRGRTSRTFTERCKRSRSS